jgi:hypothetical protein
MRQSALSVLLLFAVSVLFAQADHKTLTLYNGNAKGAVQTPLRLGNWAGKNPAASFELNTIDNGTSNLDIHSTRWGNNFLLTRDDPKGTMSVLRVYGANNSNTAVSIFNAGNTVSIALNSQADSYFNGGGGLAIGATSAAGYKLAVNGTAVFTKAIVKPFPWADYVFDKDYRLPTLDSVSRFIAAHHHLPDMPSADSVAAAGIDVGQNQSLLLKKIEELTLYIIQQQKEIEELRKQVRGYR